jgi:hypothetical protein
MTRSTSVRVLGLAFAAAVSCATVAAAAPVVTFVPGTYSLAYSEYGPAVDTLAVTVSGGVASFVLSGDDTATFSVPDMSTPAGLVYFGGPNPYYLSASLPAVSFDATANPYLSFFSTLDGGGFNVGDEPDGSGNNFLAFYQVTSGTAQVYTIAGVPEPAAWATMLLGLGIAGAVARRRRRFATA